MKLHITSLALLSTISSVVNASGDVVSLTAENFHTLTAGKAVFIKFFAPWCGHCKSMAADYEQLAAAHSSVSTKLIAEVDCTAEESEPLCKDAGVQGFPTLKYGNPASLSDYDSGRDFESMNDFVTNELKLSCSPDNMDLCSDEEKAAIEVVQNMAVEDLEEQIKKVDEALAAADKVLEDGIEGLQEKYEAMNEAHEQEVQKVKEENDYSMKKAVLKFKKGSTGNDEL